MPRLFITSLLTLFTMTSAFAEDQIVKINGAIISGQIVSEDGDAVVLSIRGIELRIPKSEIRELLIVDSRSGGTVFARGETGNGRKGKGKRKSLKQVDYLADLVPKQL